MEGTVFLLLLIVVDIAIWTRGVLGKMSDADRFRMRTVATLLLYPILGTLFGWCWGSALFAIGLWIAAILVARLDSAGLADA